MENNQFISFKNAKIFYRVTGKGKTVVLIHGFGEDGNIWNDTVETLRSNFRVIVPDIPGSGKSTILKEENTQISMEDYAEVIIRVLENESIDNCSVIGHLILPK